MLILWILPKSVPASIVAQYHQLLLWNVYTLDLLVKCELIAAHEIFPAPLFLRCPRSLINHLYCFQLHITLSWCSSCSGSSCGDSPRLPAGSLLAYKWPTCWCRSYMLMLGDSGGKERTQPGVWNLHPFLISSLSLHFLSYPLTILKVRHVNLSSVEWSEWIIIPTLYR